MFIDELNLVSGFVASVFMTKERCNQISRKVGTRRLISNGHTDESPYSPATQISHNPPTDSQGWVCRTKQ
jgi:hypothetical protein